MNGPVTSLMRMFPNVVLNGRDTSLARTYAPRDPPPLLVPSKNTSWSSSPLSDANAISSSVSARAVLTKPFQSRIRTLRGGSERSSVKLGVSSTDAKPR